MENLGLAKERLSNAKDKHENEYQTTITKLNDKENELIKRMDDLNNKKHNTCTLHGNVNVSNDDLVEINVGSAGTIITVKRSILTFVKGSRMEVLFSGRWDKVPKRDGNGRILLSDINPAVFQFIVNYLDSLMKVELLLGIHQVVQSFIGDNSTIPYLPKLDDEYFHLLPYHLELFGIVLPMLPDSSIILNSIEEVNRLHSWLEEVDQGTPSIWERENRRHVHKSSDGEFKLIYRSSRDGLSNTKFRWKLGNGFTRTITIIETTCGIVLGGYSDLPWVWSEGYETSTKTFLFVLRKSDISAPVKLNQTGKGYDGDCAIYNCMDQGASFGAGHDLEVDGSIVKLSIGCTYEAGPFKKYSSKDNTYAIKEIEVYHVTEMLDKGAIPQQNLDKEALEAIPKYKSVSGFSDAINKAIKERQESLRLAEVEVSQLETAFKGEESFVNKFAAVSVAKVD